MWCQFDTFRFLIGGTFIPKKKIDGLGYFPYNSPKLNKEPTSNVIGKAICTYMYFIYMPQFRLDVIK
jgi:hypothetical protein